MEQDRWFAAATTTNQPANPYGNFAVSGSATAAGTWCAGCGRKLAFDGHCERCDAWHASPLVQVGAPLVALTTVLVVFLIGALRGPAPAASPTPAPVVPSLLIAAPPVFQPAVITAPAPMPAAPILPPMPPPYFAAAAAADANKAPSAAYAELERLRSLSHYVDAALAADEAARAPMRGGATAVAATPAAY